MPLLAHKGLDVVMVWGLGGRMAVVGSCYSYSTLALFTPRNRPFLHSLVLHTPFKSPSSSSSPWLGNIDSLSQPHFKTPLPSQPWFSTITRAPQGLEEEDEEEEEEDLGKEINGSLPSIKVARERRFPLLSNKEKKQLRAYAHRLGKKLISHQVGKSGVTEAVAKSIGDCLEANEVIKLRVLDNCPEEHDDVIQKLEESTESQVVGNIGNTFILYRPSLRKIDETEKKQARSPAQFQRVKTARRTR